MADEVTRPRLEGEEEVQDIQVTLSSQANPLNVRGLKVSSQQSWSRYVALLVYSATFLLLMFNFYIEQKLLNLLAEVLLPCSE